MNTTASTKRRVLFPLAWNIHARGALRSAISQAKLCFCQHDPHYSSNGRCSQSYTLSSYCSGPLSAHFCKLMYLPVPYLQGFVPRNCEFPIRESPYYCIKPCGAAQEPLVCAASIFVILSQRNSACLEELLICEGQQVCKAA